MADKRRALILAGGGMKVGYQAGALQVLLDEARSSSTTPTAPGWLPQPRDGAVGPVGHADRQQLAPTGPFELTSLQAPWRYLAPWKLPRC